MTEYNSNNKSKNNFDSFLNVFKEKRENVISVLKIIVQQNKTEEFKQIINSKSKENDIQMSDFIKNKYTYFSDGMKNINDSKSVTVVTEEVLNQLEHNIQNFLQDFSEIYLDKIIKKEALQNIKEEKQKLQLAYIFFAYLNKANVCLKSQQYELTIRVINTAKEKFLKSFPLNSLVYKRGEEYISKIKNKITNLIEEKLTNWLINIQKEQSHIGETLFTKIKNEEEKFYNSKSQFSGDSQINIRTTKNIIDNLLLIRNTANLNYMMNKNSALKSSILKQGEIFEELDIINMVSNVDLTYLEQSYCIYKKVDEDIKFIEYFGNFRQSLLQNLIKIPKDLKNYNSYFSDLLGYIILQIAIFELIPVLYSKRKFEDNLNYFLKEFVSNLSYEFNNLNILDEFINLEKGIFIFIKAIERIGLSEKIGIDIKSNIFEMLKEKSEDLNFLLIKKYDNLFLNMLFEEKFLNIEIHNKEDLMKNMIQYSITLEGNNFNNSYPFKLPYTNFVIEVNENFKKYIDEIFQFISPLYTNYENIIESLVRNFIKKMIEVFHTFSNLQEQDMNIILAAHICNNIKYINMSKDFYNNYIIKKFNLKNVINIFDKDSFKNTWENYEEIIYENLKNKIKQFLSELSDENWLPEKPNGRHSYIEGMIAYLSVIYDSLYNLSTHYVNTCFIAAVEYIPKIYFQEVLFNINNSNKNYNLYFIEDFKEDIQTLDEFLNKLNTSENSISFNKCLYTIKNVLSTFYNKKYELQNHDKFYEVKIPNLINFLLRYKNLKKNEKKGKITEKEILSIVKRLKENK